ncbi:uncharacterized protein LOC117301238 [Asterias rubens]|uniref:uncharacterized protein LOC117301238 n=1 Tax=Asterias rubens TaxID=7604 RepID=UPI001455CC7C|nr:uncharacterized protein LOC117301238 [Asterias rubens]
MSRLAKGPSTVCRTKTLPGRNFDKPKTLSYTQLKEENSSLQKRNSELEHKFSKLNNALNVSQRNAKEFDKENTSLREELKDEQVKHTDYVDSVTREWTSQKQMLNDKLSRCEVKLEDLGVDPVALNDFPITDYDDATRRETLARVEILQERLTENITTNQEFLNRIKDISSQSIQALEQLDAE